MKNISALIVIALFLFSCRKEEHETPDKKMVPVTFVAEAFQQSVKDITPGVSDAELAAEHLEYLYCFIFNGNGTLVNAITQVKSNDPQFGTFRDTLQYGDSYKALFFGSKKELDFNLEGYAESHLKFSEDDIFFNRSDFNLGSYNPIRQSFALDRIIGKLNLVIQDRVPQNVSYLKIKRNSASQFYFNGNIPVNGDSELKVPVEKYRGTTIPPVSLTTIEKDENVSLTIEAYDNADNVVSARYVTVQPIPNKMITLTGLLFVNTAQFTVLVNHEWSKDEQVVKWW